MATWLPTLTLDSASPLMEQLTSFHDHSMSILIMITSMVGYLLMELILNKLTNRYLLENQTIELIWTMLPAVILIFIALPSLQLLYLIDEMKTPSISVKTIGHQWFWSYEYSDFKSIEFDSYMNIDKEAPNYSMRLLDVDNRLVLPYNLPIRLIVTSDDVIHSWAIPSLGIKIDATPGRLNQTSFMMNRTGLFFGQCSEICGTNHSFMPIVVESISMNKFSSWIKNF
uniref:Cytochrome c oxidase subunit 2 n=1 Tax=Endelus continentalis TaxID=2984121 RepID=A0A977TPZ9_9COLE|nr:cytochrome c oxidase subunit II [Endelus continentalis]UXX50473.1 cytochrome c oxidase subunit II [Endelus continentalis]